MSTGIVGTNTGERKLRPAPGTGRSAEFRAARRDCAAATRTSVPAGPSSVAARDATTIGNPVPPIAICGLVGFRNYRDALGQLLEGVGIIERNNQPRRRQRHFLGVLQLHQMTPDCGIDVVYQSRNQVRQADAVENAFAWLEDANPHRTVDYSDLGTP